MKRRSRLLVASVCSLVALVGVPAVSQASEPQPAELAPTDSSRGAAFAMTNSSADNRIITYRRAANGTLTRVGQVSTRGTGIGVDLDTQGGLRLSRDHRFLYAVNAGSDNISIFAVDGPTLTFVQKIYAGDQPNSLTIHGDLLYVLNGSVAGNGIRGFRVAGDGRLTRLAQSFRALSSPIAVPGQVEFSPDGRTLLVTQKVTDRLLSPKNAIDSFAVGANGLASAEPRRNPSHGLRPFSLAFRGDGKLVVVESFNAAPRRSAASSYRLSADGRLQVISGSVPNGQTDTCWVVISTDGRYAFTANFGNGTISSYRLNAEGQLRLIDGDAASLGPKSQPVDLSLSADGHYLYLLLRGTGGVAAFEVDGGALRPLGTATGGLPVADGASGLATF